MKEKAFLKLFFSVFFVFFVADLSASQKHTPVLNAYGEEQEVHYEVLDHYMITEGDIIIAPQPQSSRFNAVITPKIGGSRWAHGILPYKISEDLPFANKLAIFQAIDHWKKHSYVDFVEINSKNAKDYLDYVLFVKSDRGVCASYVGKKGGEQEIVLSPRCTAMITVHELGHALGLWHEQSRADRDNYIRILWENIDEAHRFNFEQHLTDGKDFGEYDYQSIMHYGPYAFSKNGEKTIQPLVDGIEIGQRRQLSDRDIAVIRAMYPGDLDH